MDSKRLPSPMEHDSGFSGDDDYMDVHSPTDSSEDSVEVKVSPVSSLRHKRKRAEPRKLQEPFITPLKKRTRFKSEAAGPFRPWNTPKDPDPEKPFKYFSEERFLPPTPPRPKDEEPPTPRVPVHPPVVLSPEDAERLILGAAEAFPTLQDHPKQDQCLSRKEQRNYKNMTRERRIEANARERTRVHTISAAFDTLRKSVPSYSHNQKLSKLSVLRIACSYIMTLSTMIDGSGGGGPSLSECVENVSRTIQREGKLRKKKDDSEPGV